MQRPMSTTLHILAYHENVIGWRLVLIYTKTPLAHDYLESSGQAVYMESRPYSQTTTFGCKMVWDYHRWLSISASSMLEYSLSECEHDTCQNLRGKQLFCARTESPLWYPKKINNFKKKIKIKNQGTIWCMLIGWDSQKIPSSTSAQYQPICVPLYNHLRWLQQLCSSKVHYIQTFFHLGLPSVTWE